MFAADGVKKAEDGDKLNVTLVTDDNGWKITVTDQLFTEMAKDPSLILSGVAPREIPELRAWADNLKINLSTPKDLDLPEKALLGFPPDDLIIDVVIIHSYGIDLGNQAQVIKEKRQKCKWVHVVHTISQELANYEDEEIHEDEEELQLRLCKRADMIIAIGPKIAAHYRKHLPYHYKKVIDFTPGIYDDLLNVRSEVDYDEPFLIMVSATYNKKYFEVKGLDIAAQAINLLQDTSYHILLLVKENEDPKELESRLEIYLDKSQFTVQKLKKNTDDLKELVCKVQLAILPSLAEGFGTSVLLPALSADVPVLVGENTGLGMALKKLDRGAEYVIGSKDPCDWAEKIKEVRKKGASVCFLDAQKLREEYMETYNKQKQCHTLVQKMWEMFSDKQGNQKRMKAVVVDHL